MHCHYAKIFAVSLDEWIESRGCVLSIYLYLYLSKSIYTHVLINWWSNCFSTHPRTLNGSTMHSLLCLKSRDWRKSFFSFFSSPKIHVYFLYLYLIPRYCYQDLKETKLPYTRICIDVLFLSLFFFLFSPLYSHSNTEGDSFVSFGSNITSFSGHIII